MSVLEKKDGVGDVLAHGRDIGEFFLGVREQAVPLRSVDGELLQPGRAPAPQAERLQ